jgi:quercetin dioxygenase-like cupin family protein
VNTAQHFKPSVLSDTELQELAAVKQFGGRDTHISSAESPWFNWVGDIEVKILRIDNRTGTFVIALQSPTDQWLGRHRHRGIVTATTIAGAWNYQEYDWVARPGDYVVETPGTIHTLHIAANTEIVYTVTGSIEFFNDDDSLSSVWDCYSFANHYVQHCDRTGQPVNQRLFY